MDDVGAGRGVASGARGLANQVGVMPGARPYVRLAVVGYLCQTAYVLFAAAVVVASGSAFMVNLPSNLLATAISLFLSAVWVQLGRKQRVSWFTAAGVAGGASAVLGLTASFGPSTVQAGMSTASQAETVVSLVYFATQLLAYYTASKVFQVRLFRYSAYLLAIGFVGGPLVAAFLVISVAAPVHPEIVTNLAYGIGLLFSAATSLTALAGFLQLGRPRT